MLPLQKKKRPNKRQRAKNRKHKQKELDAAKLDVAIETTKNELQTTLNQFVPVATQQQPPKFIYRTSDADRCASVLKEFTPLDIVVDDTGNFFVDTIDMERVQFNVNELKQEISKGFKAGTCTSTEEGALGLIKVYCLHAKEWNLDYEKLWQLIERTIGHRF